MRSLIRVLLISGFLLPCLVNGVQSQSYFGSGTLLNENDDPREEQIYQKGKKALDDRQWSAAIEAFSEAVRLQGNRVDASLYWKAYAQNKLRQYPQTLKTIEILLKNYSRSRWLNDARALELEVRQASGEVVAPEVQTDEELKLVALNGLQNSDPERAVPLIQKLLLNSNNSSRIKERALFVLAQSSAQAARDLLGKLARDNANPDLQMKALNYLGLYGGKGSRQTLAEIYATSADERIKRQILHGFMIAGDKEQLRAAVTGEKSEQLRRDAIHHLGVLGAGDTLADVYRNENSQPIKKDILHALMVGGASDRLLELARSEREPDLKIYAIHGLGMLNAKKSSEALLNIYQNEKDSSVRNEVIRSLFVQKNAAALTDLARKEADPIMKKNIVRMLSVMNSKEATEYLMELLEK